MQFFNRITLQTPESVELEFILAGIGSRALALMLDYSLLSLVLVGFITVWALFSYQLINYLEQVGLNYAGLGNWLLAIPFLICFAVFVGYFVWFETLWQGQTPGKRWAKIRVIRDDGRPVTLAQATLRALLRPLDDILSLGFFFIVLGKREKRLGDWAAGTVVVQEERPLAAASFPLATEAQPLADQLLQTVDMTKLLPDDFAVVREYLQRRSLMSPAAKSETSLRLARQVKDILAMEALPFDMKPDLFLEGVYLAYQQQSARE
jgi:uncharacterized RDD family membrane protein YckC